MPACNYSSNFDDQQQCPCVGWVPTADRIFCRRCRIQLGVLAGHDYWGPFGTRTSLCSFDSDASVPFFHVYHSLPPSGNIRCNSCTHDRRHAWHCKQYDCCSHWRWRIDRSSTALLLLKRVRTKLLAEDEEEKRVGRQCEGSNAREAKPVHGRNTPYLIPNNTLLSTRIVPRCIEGPSKLDSILSKFTTTKKRVENIHCFFLCLEGDSKGRHTISFLLLHLTEPSWMRLSARLDAASSLWPGEWLPT